MNWFATLSQIGRVKSENELAAVLAHEIAHNYRHHAVRQLGKAAYAQAAVNGLMNALRRNMRSTGRQGRTTPSNSLRAEHGKA